MDEKLKIKFWHIQKYSELYQTHKFYYRSKAFIFTFIPSYLIYYNFYESSIRKHSFIFQFLSIYVLYKISLRSLLEFDVEKNENSYIEKN